MQGMDKKAILLIRHAIVALALAAMSFCLVYFLRPSKAYDGLSDAFFVTGAVLFGVAGMLFITRQGTFDVLGYGVKRLVDQFTHHDDPEYKNAGDYSLAKQEKRRGARFPYWIYLALCLLAFALGILFLLLHKSAH